MLPQRCEVMIGFMQSIIELSRTQDEEVGDGTTSVIILGETSPLLTLVPMLYDCLTGPSSASPAPY